MAFMTMFAWNGHAEEKKTDAPKEAPPQDVEVVAVIEKEVPVYQEYVATMNGMVNATILAQVEGYLIKQNYEEGGFVKKGDLLFEIDPRFFEEDLSVAKAILARHQAILQTAQATLKRILPLAEARAVSQKDKDDAVGRVQASEAEVLAAKAQVRKAQVNLGFTKIKSPIDGIAGIAKAQIGDLVGTPQALELTTVSKVNPIKVYAPISEKQYLKAVENGKGKKRAENIQFELILTDGTTWPHKGTFGFADRQVDPKTGTIQVAILFPNPDNVLRPGQYAKIKALMKTDAAVMVPQRAVGELQGIHQVAVVQADNTVKLRRVRVGETYEGNWIIEEGLKAGERVVAEGIQKVRDGVKVNPMPYKAKQKG